MRFIFNPCSGRNRNSRLLPMVRDFISARGLDADVAATEGPGHATELAREAVAGGCRRVIAVGGDGTMNEVAQALVNSPSTLASPADPETGLRGTWASPPHRLRLSSLRATRMPSRSRSTPVPSTAGPSSMRWGSGWMPRSAAGSTT